MLLRTARRIVWFLVTSSWLEELNTLFGNVTIASGGVIPFVHSELLPEKKEGEEDDSEEEKEDKEDAEPSQAY